MKEQLIQYGFTERIYPPGFSGNWLVYQKNEWTFEYCLDDNYMWLHAPSGGDDEGLSVSNLTYEKTIKLIEFISEYE